MDFRGVTTRHSTSVYLALTTKNYRILVLMVGNTALVRDNQAGLDEGGRYGGRCGPGMKHRIYLHVESDVAAEGEVALSSCHVLRCNL